MPAMTKRVNIRANVAVRNVNPPIHGTCNDVIMTTGDILKCLCKRAHVEEILPNGTTVTLNMKNYFTDNGAGLFVKKDKPVVEKKPEPEIGDKAPEAPKAPVVETADEKKEDDSVSSSENVADEEWGKTEVTQTLTAESENVSETDESEETTNEEAAGVTDENSEDVATDEEKKGEEEIPVMTSGYVTTEDDAAVDDAEATTTATASTEHKPAKKSSKSGSKKSTSSKKK